MSVNHLQNFGNNQPGGMINSDMKWVQGINAAKAHLLAPNTTMHFWDSERQSIYIKSTDPNGIPRPITIIDYTVRGTEPVIENAGRPAIDTSSFASKDDMASLRDEVASLTSLITSISEKLDRKPQYNGKNKGGKDNV